MPRTVKELLEELRAENPDTQFEYDIIQARRDAVARLAEARREAGLSQKQLAERMGVRQSVVGRLETALDSPRLDTLARAALALGYRLTLDLAPTKAASRRRRPVEAAVRPTRSARPAAKRTTG